MGCDVYANNNEIACKAGDGKVIATFPDVCLSPPSPPAGPIPLPYPDTSFSKDMKEGSKTVMIKDKEVMLKDQSYYNTSPLGDEAATKGLGAGVVSHVITGKTYFVAWSMDVKFEGENVDRHIDMTTSNHASLVPNASVPWANMSSQQIADWEDREGLCACCNQPQHANRAGAPVVSEENFYMLNRTPPPPPGDPAALQRWELGELGSNNPANPGRDSRAERNKTVRGARKNGCLAEKPCNVYRQLTPAQTAAGRGEFNAARPDYQNEKQVLRVPGGQMATTNHLTPISGGGCPIGDNNLKPNKSAVGKNQMSDICQGYHADLDRIQGGLNNIR
jgi:hypothetical protein